MTEVRTSSLCERPCAGIEDTLEASIGTGGPQSVFDAAMAPTQESGLRENRTSRLSERAEAGRTLHLSRLYSWEADEQSGPDRSGAGGAKGGGQGEREPAKHAPDTAPGARVTSAGARTASFAVTHPRREPCAGIPLARIWAGGGQ